MSIPIKVPLETNCIICIISDRFPGNLVARGIGILSHIDIHNQLEEEILTAIQNLYHPSHIHTVRHCKVIGSVIHKIITARFTIDHITEILKFSKALNEQWVVFRHHH
jgi:hypothetical protein